MTVLLFLILVLTYINQIFPLPWFFGSGSNKFRIRICFRIRIQGWFVTPRILIHSETLLPLFNWSTFRLVRYRYNPDELKSRNRIRNTKSFRIHNTRVFPMLNSLFRNRYHSHRSLHTVRILVCLPNTEIFFSFTCGKISINFSYSLFNTVSAYRVL
jgi:hypothetical protein